MGTLRKAASYSKKIVVPFTRISKKKNKAYIKTVPPQKIVKFTMGNEQLYEKGRFPFQLTVISDGDVQIRHNALEACRQYLHKELEKNVNGQYFFRVLCYPHHIQRENKMLTGAGADRMQKGMSLSFGKSMGKAAILKKNSGIFFIALQNRKKVDLIRHLIRQVKAKMPGKIRILYGEKKRQ